jgi:amino acid adenylation domain-containing protein
VVFGKQKLSYGALDDLTNRLANVLIAHGVARGERVGIYVSKSLASVVSLFAVLKAGACYVPLDPRAPSQRLAFIIRDSGIKVLLTNSLKAKDLASMFPDNCPLNAAVFVDCDDSMENALPPSSMPIEVETVPWSKVVSQPSTPLDHRLAIETDTALILYTSGSTGNPKGVMISHRNSLTFVNWAAECVGLTPEDRVSNHAPLHFDLSTFDIFSSCKAGATVILVPEDASTFPGQLVQLIERERITVWYSVPTVLTLMALYGNIRSHDLSCLRTIIFAGEVFPTKHLRKLMNALPQVRYLNWYGPTETNVCTSYEVTQLHPERTEPVPIGKACANSDVFAVDQSGQKVKQPGQEGELYVRGPALMQGYLGQPEKTAKVLVKNPFNPLFHELVYKTGDIVKLDADGNYCYIGRQDGMVKTRGYRVELGEVESALYQHPAIGEVAVVAVPDELGGNLLGAVIRLNDGAALSREEVRAFCNEKLPSYMIPDIVEFRASIPKTSTGKTDRVTLSQALAPR